MSPYSNVPESEWNLVTKRLIDDHPLSRDDVRSVVLASWNEIFQSRFGSHGFQIGKDIYPSPQIMGFMLHELIALNLSAKFPGMWRGDQASDEKDLVYIPNNIYSIELKSSSNANNVYGNRSYAQTGNASKKSKDGYFVTVNFQKVERAGRLPNIRKIRFGWLDHSDWRGQSASTGQQASLSPAVRDNKFELLFSS